MYPYGLYIRIRLLATNDKTDTADQIEHGHMKYYPLDFLRAIRLLVREKQKRALCCLSQYSNFRHKMPSSGVPVLSRPNDGKI